MYFLQTKSTFKKFKHEFYINNCLFGSVKLTKSADPEKYKYSGYSIGFDSSLEFLFTDGSFGKKCHYLGADMSSSAHVDNKGKDILILGEVPTQELDDTTLTAKAKYPINFTQLEKRFVLSLNIMEATVSYSLMLQKYINSKQKTLK